MNKIYIKKRINKEIKKAADNEIVNGDNKPLDSSSTKMKRKRKHHQTLAVDQDMDEYTAHINKCNIELANFNNNTSIDYDWASGYINEVGYKPLRAAEGVSREDKKLHYYLDMIKRQESAEQRKIRKQSKVKNEPKPEKKILNVEKEPEPEVPLQISLITDFDAELDILAEQMMQNLRLSNNHAYNSLQLPSVIHQAFKDDKEEVDSGLQSDSHSVSTLDRLLTPVQTLKNPNSFTMIGDDNIFDSLKISNKLGDHLFKHSRQEDKIKNIISNSEPDISNSNDKSSESRLEIETFLEEILKYTKQVQNASKDVKQKSNESNQEKLIPMNQDTEIKNKDPSGDSQSLVEQTHKPKPKHISLNITKNYKSKDYSTPRLSYVINSNNSPDLIFLITRTKENGKSKNSRLESSTEVSTSRTVSQEHDRSRSAIKTCDTNAAVMLVI